MKEIIEKTPKIIIEVVYKSKDKTWRGFCSPFDISCTANTKTEAVKKIGELVEIYIDGLKKYAYPTNLTIKELSDTEDRTIFNEVLKYVIGDITSKMKNDFEKFQLEKESSSFRLTNKVKAMGTYLFLPTEIASFA